MSTENPTTANPGRDEQGKFTAGNRGGPGNPFARQVAALRQALINTVTSEDIQEIAGRLIVLAKEGNVQAAKLLLSYTIGKPQPAPEPDRMDADEWDVFRQTAPMKAEAAEVVAAGEPEFHLKTVRVTRPLVTLACQTELAKILAETPEEREERERKEAEEAEKFLSSPAPRLFDEEDDPSTNGIHGMDGSANGKKDRRRPPSANGKKRRPGNVPVHA